MGTKKIIFSNAFTVKHLQYVFLPPEDLRRLEILTFCCFYLRHVSCFTLGLLQNKGMA